jgi:hypothetical protein
MKNFIYIFLLFSLNVSARTSLININNHIIKVEFEEIIPDTSSDYLYSKTKITSDDERYIMKVLFRELIKYDAPERIKYLPSFIYICNNITNSKTNNNVRGVSLNDGFSIVISLNNPLPNRTIHHEIGHTIIHTHHKMWPSNPIDKVYNTFLTLSKYGYNKTASFNDGFVSDYASTNVVEDFCETFEEIMIGKSDAIQYIKNNPNSLLAKKFGLLIDSLNDNYNIKLGI